MRDIILSVKRSRFRSDDPFSNDSDNAYRQMRPKILKAQNYACEYCEFKSEKYQHIHHLDDDHTNNDPHNLVVACPLCHMCHHIGFAGERGIGQLIYLDPALGITQSELNALVRTLWIGSESKDPQIALQADNMLERLYTANFHAKRILKTNDLTVVGSFLMALSDKDYTLRKEKLKGFYFFPIKRGFSNELNYWIDNTKIPKSDTWYEIAKQKAGLIFD